jgi:EF hand
MPNTKEYETTKLNAFLLLTTVALASPAVAQMAPGYGGQWSSPNGWWMSGPGDGNGPAMGWYQGYGPGQGGGMMQGWRDPNAPGRGRFAMLDANDDGQISPEEAASQADMVFTSMDADDDSLITLDEFMAVRMGPQTGSNPDRQAAMQARKVARFEPMDSDKDGSVSKAEFIAASKTHFDGADLDKDGTVTPWEIRFTNWN